MMKYYFKKKKIDPVAVEKTKTGRFCQNYTFASSLKKTASANQLKF